ncbi:MAG: hypothetical protein E2P02_00045 [Acidobacteria bacterium]|nr:MAG: hypothetical protein E2P02_00045 [Acidobacteriota bacterium]
MATSSLLWRSLKAGTLETSDLERVQRRREPPTRFIQWVQGILQKRLVSRALDAKPFTIPWPARLAAKIPFFRTLLAKIIGMGPRPELVQN